MKHKRVLIQLCDLITRLDTDSDGFHLSDALGFNGSDEDCEAAHDDQWVEVTWPECVSMPRYNSDATYRPTGCKNLAELDLGDYGECLIYDGETGETLRQRR